MKEDQIHSNFTKHAIKGAKKLKKKAQALRKFWLDFVEANEGSDFNKSFPLKVFYANTPGVCNPFQDPTKLVWVGGDIPSGCFPSELWRCALQINEATGLVAGAGLPKALLQKYFEPLQEVLKTDADIQEVVLALEFFARAALYSLEESVG